MLAWFRPNPVSVVTSSNISKPFDGNQVAQLFNTLTIRTSTMVSLMIGFNEVTCLVVNQWMKLYHNEMSP